MQDTNQPSQQLEPGQLIPVFILPGADGMPHSPWDYKQREHLVLLFLCSTTTSETRGLLRTFAQQYTDFREEECAILAITPDTVIVNLQAQEALQLPFALLADPRGDVISHYTLWESSARTLTPSIVTVPQQHMYTVTEFVDKQVNSTIVIASERKTCN